MNIVTQFSLFDYTQIEELGDLERLKLVIDNAPDNKIIYKLKKLRGKGRNDWPVEAMWNAFLSSFVFQHPTIEALLRELSRNSQLRKICGIKPKYIKQKNGTFKVEAAPPASAFSNFLKNLMKCQEELDEMFKELVDFMYNNLDQFGEILALDGKAISSFATRASKEEKPDGRRDIDANWCTKTYTESTNTKGEKVIKKVTWFGYRLHLLVDAAYELPVAFSVTKASNSEKTEGKKLTGNLDKKIQEICKYLLADKGYDGTPFIEQLEELKISPIIDIRNCWKGEQTRQFKDTDIVYSYDGKVYYVDDSGEKIELRYLGYDKSSKGSRYGFHPKYKDNRVFRIPLNTDKRIFVPVARCSKKWSRLYDMRTSVERVNGRIDRDYGFENHTIRGLRKMTMYISMAFITMLSMAKGKIKGNKKKHLAALIA